MSFTEDNALSTVSNLFSMSENSTLRVKQLIQAYMIWSVAGDLVKRAKSRLNAKRSYSVAIYGDDSIYLDIQKWIISQFKPKAKKALVARSYRDYSEGSDNGRGRKHVGGHLKFFADSKRSQAIKVDGHKVWVFIEHPDNMKNASHGDYDDLPIFLTAKERIVFTASTTEGRDAVVAKLQSFAEKVAVSNPRLFIAGTFNDWMSTDEIPKRELDTVILKGNQKEAIVADLDDFLNKEYAYSRLGVPYHRGYLFHGPPGTGKTSIAKALAFHFNLNVYYIPLPTIENDNKLIRLLASVPPRSVLLLEDIDIVHGARERDDKEKGVTLSGLLNSLDGMITPHGLITIMTTNDMSVLDKALIRPGRVDRCEEITYLDDEQLNRLIEMMFGLRADLPEISREIAPAEIVEVAKRHLDYPQEAVAGIVELVKNGQ